MITNDHLVGFLVGAVYMGLFIALVFGIVGRGTQPPRDGNKGYTDHWKLEDR